jgi:streptogramin lyase
VIKGGKVAMNPTREGINQWMADNHARPVGIFDPNKCTCDDCAIGTFALRALDLQDEIQRILDGHQGKGITRIDGKRHWVAAFVYRALKEFDGE